MNMTLIAFPAALMYFCGGLSSGLRLFGSDSSPRFVNGVLGAVIAAEGRPDLGETLPTDQAFLLTPEPEPASVVQGASSQ